MFEETCRAPVNIALIKYWGKRDEELILPINDSLSITLNVDEMCATTTIAASASFKRNTMRLNGDEVVFEENPRLLRCIKQLQGLALAKGNPRFPLEWKLQIASRNNFPTASGLASSAAGYACLVYTLACLYGIEGEELSAIARQGSGSACRSVYGGFVRWQMGTCKAGTDSIAIPIAPASHWPNLHVLILVVNDGKKKTSSTKGMQRSMNTSELLKFRAAHCVPQRIAQITEAIKARDFQAFAEIAMKDSNQFHAIAMDTYPPCIYMNDTSHAIVEFVHDYNDSNGSKKIAYTLDAGPNACLYVLEEDVSAVIAAIEHAFPHDHKNNVEYFKGIAVEWPKDDATTLNGNNTSHKVYGKNLLKYIIHTKIGGGPQRLGKEASLLNTIDLKSTGDQLSN